MFFDQFFYSGGTENRPYNMQWSWKDGWFIILSKT
jgi:hypothetical protein